MRPLNDLASVHFRLGCHTTTNCTLGGSALGARNQKSADVGQKAAAELIDVVQASGCVDTYIQDQLIIFMASARGLSKVRCTMPLTLHTKTAIHIAELLTEVRHKRIFKYSDRFNDTGYRSNFCSSIVTG